MDASLSVNFCPNIAVCISCFFLSAVQICVFHILSITNVALVTKINDTRYMYEQNVPQHSYPLDILTEFGLDLKMNFRKIKVRILD